jgi:Ca2+-binding EF-hand superfamily protein
MSTLCHELQYMTSFSDDNDSKNPNFLVNVTIHDEDIYSYVKFKSKDDDEFFLQEHVYGILIPSLQQLLKLAEKENEEALCDPINWIAMQLLRKNTKHNNELLNHPYYIKLQEFIAAHKKRKSLEKDPLYQKRLEEEARKQRQAEEDEKKRILEAERKRIQDEENERLRIERELLNSREKEAIDKQLREEELRKQAEEEERRRFEEEEKKWRKKEKEAKMNEDQKRQSHMKDRTKLKIRMGAEALEIASDEDLEKFNQKYVNELHELFGASVYIGDLDSNSLRYNIFSKDCEEKLRGSVLNRSSGRSFDVLDSLQSILINNTSEDNQLVNLTGKKNDEHNGSVFIAPIKSLAGVKGTLTIDKSHLTGDKKFSESDKDYLDTIAKIFENAQKNADMEMKLQLIRREANKVFNKQQENVFQVGMEQILSVIPNASQCVTGMLDSPKSMECIAETAHKRPKNSARSSIVGKSITDEEHSEYFKVVQEGEIKFIGKPESKSAFFDTVGEDSGNIAHGDHAIAIPIKNEQTGKVVGVINIDTAENLTPEQLDQVKKITEEITKCTHEVQVRENLTSMSNSALEWIKATTNAKGAYFGLLQNDGTLKYVSATEGNEVMIGKTLERGTGVTFDAIDSGQVKYVPNIAKDPRIHMFQGMAKKSGSFAALPIRSKTTNQVIGILAVDKVGTTEEFSQEELKNLERSSAIISGSAPIIEKNELGYEKSSETLAIEKDVTIVKDKAKLYFLSKMLLACRSDINKLDQKALAELIGYKTPPAAVHKIIKGVLYILGHKKNEIKDWEGCRKILKDNFLQRVTTYDSTAVQKKSKFSNCKKAIAGLDYDTVEKKSSIPAAFLFKFTIVTLQLRENAVNMRKAAKLAVEEGESDEEEGKPESRPVSSMKQSFRPLSTKSVNELFDIFDGNGNGKLSFSEISSAVLRQWPQFSSDKPAIMRAYKAVDANGDGYVTKREFPNLISTLERYLEVFQIFKSLDVDGDKRISFVEFKKGYEILEIPIQSEKELKDLFEKMDANGGGYILFGEFCSFMAEQRAKHAASQ